MYNIHNYINMSLKKCILVSFTIYDDLTTCFSKTALSFKIWKALCLSTQRNNATWFFAIRFILFLSCSWHIIKWSPQSALVYLTNNQTRWPIHLYLIFEKSSLKNQVRRTGFLICKNQFRNWFFQAT